MDLSGAPKTETLIPLITGARLDGIRVLLVDDHLDVIEFLQHILEERGASVALATSATAAVEEFERGAPDIIVSDIGMPEENGHSLMRRLRALEVPGSPRIPAIALTGHDRPEDRLAAMQAGFQIHVSKPVESEEFLTIVATFAGRH